MKLTDWVKKPTKSETNIRKEMNIKVCINEIENKKQEWLENLTKLKIILLY